MPALLLTILMIAIGWFFLVRPQQERLREQKAMVAALVAGDRIITAGGIHGIIARVDDDTLLVEVAPGVQITLARQAVSRRIDPSSEPGDAPVADPKDAQVEDTVTESNPGAGA